MKKLLAYITLVILIGCESSESSEKKTDFFIWDSAIKVSWKEYQGKPPLNPPAVAVTQSEVSMSYKFELDTILFYSSARFMLSSYYVKGMEDGLLLNHEQRHFDITEIFARKLRKFATNWDRKSEFEYYIEVGYDSIMRAGSNFQNLYDIESDHGRNVDLQNLWDQKIDSLLAVYKNYTKSPEKIPLR